MAFSPLDIADYGSSINPDLLSQTVRGPLSTGVTDAHFPDASPFSQYGGMGKLGFNVPTINLALGGLNTIGSLYAAFQQNALAKKQFAYTKNVTDTNLANQIKAYNTTLADRARSRAATEGQTQAQADAYVNDNKLNRQAY